MVITSFNKDNIRRNIVDEYISVVWAERYNEYGDFSIELPFTEENFEAFGVDEYIECDKSDKIMIVKSKEKDDESKVVTFSGVSIDHILTERIVKEIDKYCTYDETIKEYSENINLTYNVIKQMFKDTFLYNNANPERYYKNFDMIESMDPSILSHKIETTTSEISDRTFYNILKFFCDDGDFGFRVNVDTRAGQDFHMTFEIYNGYNRSRDSINPVVISYEYGNLLSSNYFTSVADVKNAALIRGSQSDMSQKDTTGKLTYVYPEGVFYGSATGHDRKEIYIVADDIVPPYSKYYTEGGSLKMEVVKWLTDIGKDERWLLKESIPYQYESALLERARRTLNSLDYKPLTTLDGDIDPFYQFVFGIDYFLGDIIELENEYEIYKAVRISEAVITDDVSGYMVTPTFLALENEEETE